MLWKRFLSFSLLGLMLLVQAHAALPHQHNEEGANCGAVCHVHDAACTEAGWWESLLHGVHDVLHQHAASMDCEEEAEALRPAVDGEAPAWEATAPLIPVGAPDAERTFEHPCQRANRPLTPGYRRGSPQRGPPSRG